MDDHGVRAAIDTLLERDLAVCSRGDLDDVVHLTRRVRGWLDALDVAIAARATVLAAAGESESAAGVLADRGRRCGRDARAAAARAQVCALLPSFAAALAAGAVAAGHLDALARLIGRLDDTGRSGLAAEEPALLALARSEPVSMFERECRDLSRHLGDDTTELDRQRRHSSVRRWVDRRTGMHHLHAELDPERGTIVADALDAHLATLTQRDGNAGTPLDSLGVDAFVELVTGSSAVDPRVPEIIVIVDEATLCAGRHAETLCETSAGVPLPVDTVRRMCCDAVITGVNFSGDRLTMGREIRTANRQQRRALRAMYRTCAHPDCHVLFDHCRIHHVIWWERLGTTDLDNLVPLCSQHHHLVHEGRWQLSMTPDRTITLTRPDGTHYYTGNTSDRRRPTGSYGSRPPTPGTPAQPSPRSAVSEVAA